MFFKNFIWRSARECYICTYKGNLIIYISLQDLSTQALFHVRPYQDAYTLPNEKH